MFVDKFIFQKHLEKEEEILFTAHKHWVEFFGPFLTIAFFGFLLPWGLYFAGFKSDLFFWSILIWNGLAFLKLFHDFIDWYSDVWLFTNMSVIIVEWHGLFSNTSQRVSYEDSEGISFVIKGFLGTIFRYGDVTLKVVSGSHITLKNGTKPKRVELALMKYQGEYMHRRETAHAGGLKELLSQMISHHLRKKK